MNFAWQQGAGSSAAMGALNFAIGMLTGASGAQSTGVAGVGNIALQFGPGTMTNIGSLNLTLASATGGDGSKGHQLRAASATWPSTSATLAPRGRKAS